MRKHNSVPMIFPGEHTEQGDADDENGPSAEAVEEMDQWYLAGVGKIEGKGERRKGAGKGGRVTHISTIRPIRIKGLNDRPGRNFPKWYRGHMLSEC